MRSPRFVAVLEAITKVLNRYEESFQQDVLLYEGPAAQDGDIHKGHYI